jgi:hypothetical protein
MVSSIVAGVTSVSGMSKVTAKTPGRIVESLPHLGKFTV